MIGGLDNILALNAAHEAETSVLDRLELADMLGNAFYSANRAEGRDGFLIAFDQDAAYDSINFLWFKTRYDRFVYVDRVIVASHARGQGVARSFYRRLFECARKAGQQRIVCEINLDPPNPGSLAFHAALGFSEVGQAELQGGKVVSYQLAEVRTQFFTPPDHL
jgi:uncharacterized protein